MGRGDHHEGAQCHLCHQAGKGGGGGGGGGPCGHAGGDWRGCAGCSGRGGSVKEKGGLCRAQRAGAAPAPGVGAVPGRCCKGCCSEGHGSGPCQPPPPRHQGQGNRPCSSQQESRAHLPVCCTRCASGGAGTGGGGGRQASSSPPLPQQRWQQRQLGSRAVRFPAIYDPALHNSHPLHGTHRPPSRRKGLLLIISATDEVPRFLVSLFEVFPQKLFSFLFYFIFRTGSARAPTP